MATNSSASGLNTRHLATSTVCVSRLQSYPPYRTTAFVCSLSPQARRAADTVGDCTVEFRGVITVIWLLAGNANQLLTNRVDFARGERKPPPTIITVTRRSIFRTRHRGLSKQATIERGVCNTIKHRGNIIYTCYATGSYLDFM